MALVELIHALDLVLRLQAKKLMEPWVLLLKAGQEIGRLVSSLIGMLLLIWIIQARKLFYPLPPSLGPGVYLGAVERVTSFIADDLWYGSFAGTNPETYVRADGAFITFTDDFDMAM